MSLQFKSRRYATEAVLFALAVLIGLARVSAARHLINPDGISYLDLGDAYLRGDWSAAINGYWSPLSPVLFGLALKILRPSPALEFPMVHYVIFGIYIAALLCFRFFWKNLIHYHAAQRKDYDSRGLAQLPEPVWIAFGYAIFLVSCVEFINLEYIGADMSVTAIVYLAAGVLLRIRRGPVSWKLYFFFGILLGFGYLAKAVMLPLSGAFILASLRFSAGWRRTLCYVASVLAGLILIATPYIWALSKHYGHLTYSESRDLMYAFNVDGIPFWWAGDDPPGFGHPIHPRTRIFENPPAYTFEGSPRGTYPGWYEPPYWLAGLQTRFNLRGQLFRLKVDGQILFDIFFGAFQVGFVISALVWYLFGAERFRVLPGLLRQWFFFLPLLAAIAIYWPIWVDPRYIAPFLGLFWAGIFGGVRMPASPQSRRLLFSTAAAVVPLTFLVVLASTAAAFDRIGNIPVQFRVADYLRQIGVRPGDRVGAVGRVMECGWARLARVQITTEINHGSDAAFRASAAPVRSAVVAAMFHTGIRAIVSDSREDSGCPSNWHAVDSTGFYVCAP